MILEDDIFTIAQNILSTMLEIEANPVGPTPIVKRLDQVTGCIQISGEWQGAVVIQSSVEFARTVASRLFDESLANLLEDDLRDAFAELTNMIGGNIKGQVPCPSFLSIPSVTTGQDFDVHLSNATIIRDLVLDCNGEKLRIMMFEEDRSQPSRVTQRKLGSIAN